MTSKQTEKEQLKSIMLGNKKKLFRLRLNRTILPRTTLPNEHESQNKTKAVFRNRMFCSQSDDDDDDDDNGMKQVINVFFILNLKIIIL